MANPVPTPGRAAGQVPRVWGRVPPRNKNFTGREELLGQLRESIAGRPTAVVPQFALSGLGGVGKTQVAMEYAYRYNSEYDLIWWIPADQTLLVPASLAALAPHLGLPEAAMSGVGIEEAAGAVLDALRRGDPYVNWLLVFDNADQPEELKSLIPQGPGHVLITSRNQRWEGVVETVTVDVFHREESVAFLTKRLKQAITTEEADRLAEALGDLPLALEQAGALQVETGMSVAEYLALLADRTSQLLSVGRPTEYRAPMTAAWQLSVTSLAEKMPEALDLLRCCAFFGPDPIPRDVFTRPRAGIGPQLAGLLTDPIRLSRAIGELNRYALARVDSIGRTIQVHRLVQALVRDELPAAEQERIRSNVHLLLAEYARGNPDEPANRPRYRSLLGHVQPAQVADSALPEVRDLGRRIVRFLFISGDLPSAQATIQTFLRRWAHDSGDEHPDVLSLRIDLADVLRELGDYRGAYQTNLKTSATAENVLSEDHPTRLRLNRGLAADLRARGEFDQALARDEEVLRHCRSTFGEEDPRTLRTLNSLALDHALSGRYQKARELHQQAYEGHVKTELSGSATASMLNAWSGLARVVRLCGEYAEACDIGEEAYFYAVEQLGNDHNWTLRTGRHLCIAHRRNGELDKALEMALEIHARYVRIFGLDHPDTLATAICLSNLQRNLADYEPASTLAKDTMARYTKIYGPDHPFYFACLGNLAIVHRVEGDPVSAREANEKARAGLEARLGRNHHFTLTAAINLASDLAELKDHGGACELGRDTLPRLREALGERHPITLACAANLSLDLLAAGEEEDASRLHDETKEGYTRTLGLGHQDAKVFLASRRLDPDFEPLPV